METLGAKLHAALCSLKLIMWKAYVLLLLKIFTFTTQHSESRRWFGWTCGEQFWAQIKHNMCTVGHNRILNICWGNNRNCTHHCFPYTYCSFYGCFYTWFCHLSWFNSIVLWGPQYVTIRVNTSSSCLPLKLGNDFHCYWSVCPFGSTSKSRTERRSRFSATNSQREMWRMWAETAIYSETSSCEKYIILYLWREYWRCKLFAINSRLLSYQPQTVLGLTGALSY